MSVICVLNSMPTSMCDDHRPWVGLPTPPFFFVVAQGPPCHDELPAEKRRCRCRWRTWIGEGYSPLVESTLATRDSGKIQCRCRTSLTCLTRQPDWIPA